jgi:hypothetical protein
LSQAEKIPADQWRNIRAELGKGKFQTLRVNDGVCQLRHYEGEVRQIIITEHGYMKPAFLVTNDTAMDVALLVKKYARRWLVEQEIAGQIVFFHLNQPSSPVVAKVDSGLTLSLLAHNLCRVLSKNLDLNHRFRWKNRTGVRGVVDLQDPPAAAQRTASSICLRFAEADSASPRCCRYQAPQPPSVRFSLA